MAIHWRLAQLENIFLLVHSVSLPVRIAQDYRQVEF